jgi:hypothetical protein
VVEVAVASSSRGGGRDSPDSPSDAGREQGRARQEM